MRGRTSPAFVVFLGVLMLPAGVEAQGKINRDQSGYTNLREEGYPVKSELTVVSAEEADLGDDEMVLGVVAGGEARAYPVNLMWEPENEVLNDTVGGAALTATW